MNNVVDGAQSGINGRSGGSSVDIVRLDPRPPNHGGDNARITTSKEIKHSRVEGTDHRGLIQTRESGVEIGNGFRGERGVGRAFESGAFHFDEHVQADVKTER